jgi:outer membrane beta-barrel protein
MKVWTTLVLGSSLLCASHVSAQDADPKPAEAPVEAAKEADPTTFERIEKLEPREGTPIIENKLHPMDGKIEINGAFDLSFGNKYISHLGGHLGLAYHVFDWLGVELFGGYLVGSESNITKSVRLKGGSIIELTDSVRAGRTPNCSSPTCEPILPDLWQTTWFAGANLQWAPIYGKISAVSEYDLNFQLYGRVGGGAEGIQQALTAGGVTAGAVRPTANFGAGIRLMPFQNVAIRAEVVNYLGLNPNVLDRPDDESKCTDGYTLLEDNARVCKSDLSNNTYMQLGLSFIF